MGKFVVSSVEINHKNRQVDLTFAGPLTPYRMTTDTVAHDPEPRDLLSLWHRYGDLLWEENRHKSSVCAFVCEADDHLKRSGSTVDNPQIFDLLTRAYRQNGNRNSTINRKISAVHKLMARAERDGVIHKVPYFSRLKEQNGRIRFLSRDEERGIFSEIGKYDPVYRSLCIFLIDTGARVGEALKLKWTDISDLQVTFWETKSGRPRTLPLTARAREALGQPDRHRASHGPFCSVDYQRLRYHWIKARNAMGLATDDQVVLHILRHTCASRLVQSGIDLRRIQTFLGHQTIQMTLRYAHLSTNDLRSCADALELYRQKTMSDPDQTSSSTTEE